MKIVLDTNVLISAVLFGGKPQQILDGALTGKIKICISESLLAEFQGVLGRPKFGLTTQILQTMTTEIISLAEWITPGRKVDVIKEDPCDNRVLECAIEAKADFIVSGDRHLLELGTYGDIRVLDPSGFLSAIEEHRS